METPFYLTNGNYRLFCILHAPDQIINRTGPKGDIFKETGVIVCSPFAEEKLIAHRVLVNLARELSENGFYCLRFDYMGQGDSDGKFEESTVNTQISDIACAIRYLEKETAVRRIVLLGLRFGATLSCLVCRNGAEVDGLVLIAPIINGKTYLEQCLRSNLATQMVTYKKIEKNSQQLVHELMEGRMINFDGYLLSKAMYEEIERIHLLAGEAFSAKHILFIEISSGTNWAASEETKVLYSKSRSNSESVELKQVSGEQVWKDNKVYVPRERNLEVSILEWMTRTYR